MSLGSAAACHHCRALTLTPGYDLQSTLCMFLDCGGTWNTWRKPSQTWAEHTNYTEKPRLGLELETFPTVMWQCYPPSNYKKNFFLFPCCCFAQWRNDLICSFHPELNGLLSRYKFCRSMRDHVSILFITLVTSACSTQGCPSSIYIQRW